MGLIWLPSAKLGKWKIILLLDNIRVSFYSRELDNVAHPLVSHIAGLGQETHQWIDLLWNLSEAFWLAI